MAGGYITPPGINDWEPLLRRIDDIERRLREVESPSGTQRALSVEKLQATVDTLLALQNVQYAEFTTGFTASVGWYAGAVPTVNLSSPTGRIEINFGGALNSGDGYFCYSVTTTTGGIIVNRTTVQTNPAQRVAVSGGASFSPSGTDQAFVTVPVGVGLVVKLELYAGTAGTFFLGGSISARPSL